MRPDGDDLGHGGVEHASDLLDVAGQPAVIVLAVFSLPEAEFDEHFVEVRDVALEGEADVEVPVGQLLEVAAVPQHGEAAAGLEGGPAHEERVEDAAGAAEEAREGLIAAADAAAAD